MSSEQIKNDKNEKIEKNEKTTPMMVQYLETKKQYPDCLLFYRLGDFYELFFEDAKIASQILNIQLTERNRAKGGNIPMCGVPFHAYENYLVRLVKAGYKVAICEQTEDPAEAKKRGATAIVKRDVIRIVTAGTLTEDSLLNARRHNFLTAIVPGATEYGVAWADMSTGNFYTQTASAQTLNAVLARVESSEILVSETFDAVHAGVLDENLQNITKQPTVSFDYAENKNLFCEFFNLSPDEIPAYFTKSELIAIGVILNYVLQTQKGECPNLLMPQKININTFMEIDVATRNSLELTRSQSRDKNAGSLLSNIDFTVTGAGARMLAMQLAAPLVNPDEINLRYDRIDYFLQYPEQRENTRAVLKKIGDIERSVSRLSVGRGGPRDLYAVGYGLSLIPELRTQINGAMIPSALMDDLYKLGNHSELTEEILHALREPSTATDTDEGYNLPMLVREGGFIRKGYHGELDRLMNLKDGKKRERAILQQKYIAETGINNLKISYNKLVGFFIEVPLKQAEHLLANPQAGFIHRQTLTNNVRFTTAELINLETTVAHVDDEIARMEEEIFNQLCNMLASQNKEIKETCMAIARIDIATASATGAEKYHWVRPVITTDTTFDIKGGRHPVVEKALMKNHQTFVPNDCNMSEGRNKLWILTGPNMAGKSTFLRQNAIIAIMAQAGFFVPADSAHIGIIDKVFSRVGASDDLARGRSTFMVEMVEVADILKNASPKSLVILDEVGRGTATYDGLSIAWAVVEYLHDKCRCRGLFATHYHELTALVNRLDNISLHTMRVKEWHGDIVFMHEITDGAIDRSYGIHVAKLAGLPESVVARAEQILEQLEEKRQHQKPLFDDLPLFSQIQKTTSIPKESEVEKQVRSVDVDALSPREALDFIYRLKRLTEEN